MKDKKLNISIAITLIVLAVSLRLLPHPANFAPVAAVAIFGGAVLPRRLAIWLPVVVMAISDVIIGLYPFFVVTWACYVVIALASNLWLKGKLGRGVLITLGGSTFFFVVTNFAVWLWGGMYTHSWAGLVNCYYMALPFFRNTALSDVSYTAMLFGLFALAKAIIHSKLSAEHGKA